MNDRIIKNKKTGFSRIQPWTADTLDIRPVDHCAFSLLLFSRDLRRAEVPGHWRRWVVLNMFFRIEVGLIDDDEPCFVIGDNFDRWYSHNHFSKLVGGGSRVPPRTVGRLRSSSYC